MPILLTWWCSQHFLPFSLPACSRHDYLTFCTSGYRAAIASSILKEAGFKVRDIRGGFAAVSVYAPELTTSEKVYNLLPHWIKIFANLCILQHEPFKRVCGVILADVPHYEEVSGRNE